MIRYLSKHRCILLREGGRHGIFLNESNGKTAPVLRHRESDGILGAKICQELEMPAPKER